MSELLRFNVSTYIYIKEDKNLNYWTSAVGPYLINDINACCIPVFTPLNITAEMLSARLYMYRAKLLRPYATGDFIYPACFIRPL